MQALVAHDGEPLVGEIARHLGVHRRPVGGQDGDALDPTIGPHGGRTGIAADADLDAGDLLHLAGEAIRAFLAVEKCDRRHAHDQVVWTAGHDASHRIQRVGGDDLGASAKAFVAHGIGVRRENAAEVVGYAGRLHGVEVGLDDGVGRWSQNAELAAPS